MPALRPCTDKRKEPMLFNFDEIWLGLLLEPAMIRYRPYPSLIALHLFHPFPLFLLSSTSSEFLPLQCQPCFQRQWRGFSRQVRT